MIYDFSELLGRGIIAARTNRNSEAQKYLRLAAKVKPENLRVWLWLASSADTTEQAQRYLEEALSIDPELYVARVLLQRLQGEKYLEEQTPVVSIFKCPNCGGENRYDPDIGGLLCDRCAQIEYLEIPEETGLRIQLEAVLGDGDGNWAIVGSRVDCNACGAQVVISAERSNHSCSFCGSEQITLRSATPGLINPTAIVPFRLHSNDVAKILEKWLQLSLTKVSAMLEIGSIEMSAIYLPFWVFESRVQLRSTLGYRIPIVEYNEKERMITKGEWPVEEDWFECEIESMLVYGARSIASLAIEAILPYDLKGMIGYVPEILAGWQAEMYQLSLEDAYTIVQKQMRDYALRKAAKNLVFIEPTKLLQNDIVFGDQTYKLVLLPVWFAKIRDGSKVNEVLINGQTGKLFDEKSRKQYDL